MAVFTPRPLQIPNMRTDYSAENSAFSNLGQTLGSMPSDFRKEQLNAQKQQILGDIASGKLDYDKAGRGLIALGDTTAGATLLTLGQKDKDRELERSWMGGGAAPAVLGASPSSAPVASPGDPSLPAGMRNNNPGNIKFVGQRVPGIVGPSKNTDQGDPQAVFDTPESGMAAAYGLAMRKYSGGKRTANDLIAGNMGWTPGNFQAAANIARTMGIRPDDDLRLDDPTRAQAFMRALLLQEHGKASLAYSDDMIGGAIRGRAPQPAQAAGSAPVQVAETEADVQRLERQQSASQSITGDDPAKLRADAQYYAQSNPEAARQMLARAEAVERSRGVQVAQAPAQPGAPVADAPAPGAAPAQGFAIPGEPAQQSILNDKNVQLWTQRHATAPTERTRAIAKQQLDLAVKDAEQRYAEGKTPEAVREFVWAKRNGMTEARSPAEYAREKEKPKGPMTISEGQRLVDPETGRVIVEAQSGAKTSREIDERTAIADRQGLQGEAREAYILNGRIPVGAEKTTEGQANAALYADRMKEAEAILLQPAIAEASASRMQRGLSGVPIYGNSLVSPEFQQADQAKRNFINAALRRESGAVISPEEFENAEKQYFPQPGDSKQVLQQKARNRQTAIQGISNAAGPSYAKRQAQQPQQQFREGQRASNGHQTIVFRNGQWVPE